MKLVTFIYKPHSSLSLYSCLLFGENQTTVDMGMAREPSMYPSPVILNLKIMVFHHFSSFSTLANTENYILKVRARWGGKTDRRRDRDDPFLVVLWTFKKKRICSTQACRSGHKILTLSRSNKPSNIVKCRQLILGDRIIVGRSRQPKFYLVRHHAAAAIQCILATRSRDTRQPGYKNNFKMFYFWDFCITAVVFPSFREKNETPPNTRDYTVPKSSTILIRQNFFRYCLLSTKL